MLHVAGAAAICAAIAIGGCGESGADSNPDRRKIATIDLEATFAPLVSLHPRESRMPAGGTWFVKRSMLLFAEDHGCPDRKIAVGRTLNEQRTVIVNWLPPAGLGKGMYWRNPHNVHCGLDFDRRFFTDQHTRPYDDARSDRLGDREGWTLDLVDRARNGEGRRRRMGRQTVLESVPSYVGRRGEEVDGEPGLRLSYWLLYGLNEPRSADGIEGQLVHEGDWERVDVLLQRTLGADAYRPVSLVLYSDGDHRAMAWRDVIRIEDRRSGKRTHPLLLAARGSHTLAPGSGWPCPRCPAWRTWQEVADLREQPWYGFGGAWGDVEDNSLTTGPLGPHDGDWPTPAEVAKRPS